MGVSVSEAVGVKLGDGEGVRVLEGEGKGLAVFDGGDSTGVIVAVAGALDGTHELSKNRIVTRFTHQFFILALCSALYPIS